MLGDSHDWQLRSLQQRPTQSLDITVVNIMEVVTSLRERREIKSSKKMKNKRKKLNEITHLPSSVDLVDIVDHLTGQGCEAGSGQAYRQAGSQQQKG